MQIGWVRRPCGVQPTGFDLLQDCSGGWLRRPLNQREFPTGFRSEGQAPVIDEHGRQVLVRSHAGGHEPVPALGERGLAGLPAGRRALRHRTAEAGHPIVAAVLAPEPEHGRGISHGLVRWMHFSAGPVQHARFLLRQTVHVREGLEERQVAGANQRFHALDGMAGGEILIDAAQGIHAHVAHEHGVAGCERGVAIAEGEEVPAHFVEHIMWHGVRVFPQRGIIPSIEHGHFNAAGADVAATGSAGEVKPWHGGNRHTTVELFEGFGARAGKIGVKLPPLIEAGHPMRHQDRIVGSVCGEKDNIRSSPRHQKCADVFLCPDLGTKSERLIVHERARLHRFARGCRARQKYGEPGRQR